MPATRSPSGGTGAGSLVGALLGRRFALTALIGSGSTGEVYAALDVGGGGPVAVKVLHERLRADPDVVARFRREARNAAALTHPNSLLVLEAEQDEAGIPYLVMELLPGRDLARLLREHTSFPAERAIRIACQVLAAVGEAHTRGIVHRDLKPGNIMLIARGGFPDFVKVCDYGLAKVVEAADARDTGPDGRSPSLGSETGRNVLSGTPEYMSPEQARGDPLDGRSDLYAVAIMVYEMVTGRVPFRGTSALAVLTRHLTEAPPPPSSLSPAIEIPASLERLILRGLCKDPDQRPASATAFRLELEEIATTLSAGGSSKIGVPAASPKSAFAEAPSAATVRTRVRRWRRAGSTLAVGLAVVALWPVLTPSARVSTEPPAPAGGPSIVRLDLPRPATVSAAPVVGAVTPPVVPPKSQARRAGHRHREAGDRAPAHAEIERAISAGLQLMAEGQIVEACARLESAKRLQPSSAPLHKLLGQCYMRSRRIADAKLNLRRYLELAPDATDAAFIRGIVD